jgi:hypothetical protein
MPRRAEFDLYIQIKRSAFIILIFNINITSTKFLVKVLYKKSEKIFPLKIHDGYKPTLFI